MALLSKSLPNNTIEIDTRELIERIKWVISLRWTLAVALLLVGLFRETSPADPQPVKLYYAGLALLVIGYNLYFFMAARRADFGETGTTNLVRYLQVPLDLVVFTLLLHLQGGVTSPVFSLYFVYVFIGLAILPPSGAYWVALGAAVCYSALALLEVWGWLKPPASASALVSSKPEAGIYLGYVFMISATLMITSYIANYFAGLLTKDERTIRNQLEELNTLYTVTRKMSGSFDSEEVMKTLVSVARDISKATATSLLLFNEQGEGTFAATSGFSPQEREKQNALLITADNPLIKQVIEDYKGIYAPDAEAIPGLRSLLVRHSTKSFYAIPMQNDSRLAGTLNLSFDRPYRLPQSQWQLFLAIAQQAALALERSRLFDEAERAAREMAGLYHIGLVTTSSLQIDEVMRLIYEQVVRVLHPDTFYIGLYDEDLGELRFDMFVENGEFLPPFRTRLQGGVAAYVIRKKQPLFVRNWSKEIEQFPFEAGVVGAPTQSVIIVPLTAKNKTVGVMSVQALQPDAFDREQLRLLISIAGQAALALENAKLHAQVFEQAQRDPLTGVFNHGTFIDKLQSQVRDAAAAKQTVGLIMLDIDRFKQYNDTYGHMVGDDVLRSIVVAIQNHLKSTDVVGRWGGEEFGIVLPGITRSQARLVAERIRQTAAHATLKDLHNRTIPSPTVSQGLALFPDDGTNIEELIDKADAALYRAKDLGRNQIAEWIEIENEKPITFRARGK